MDDDDWSWDATALTLGKVQSMETVKFDFEVERPASSLDKKVLEAYLKTAAAKLAEIWSDHVKSANRTVESAVRYGAWLSEVQTACKLLDRHFATWCKSHTPIKRNQALNYIRLFESRTELAEKLSKMPEAERFKVGMAAAVKMIAKPRPGDKRPAFKPKLTRSIRRKLTDLRSKHKNLSSVKSLFELLRDDIGLTKKQWTMLGDPERIKLVMVVPHG